LTHDTIVTVCGVFRVLLFVWGVSGSRIFIVIILFCGGEAGAEGEDERGGRRRGGGSGGEGGGGRGEAEVGVAGAARM
jgi:hypothetical protein